MGGAVCLCLAENRRTAFCPHRTGGDLPQNCSILRQVPSCANLFRANTHIFVFRVFWLRTVPVVYFLEMLLAHINVLFNFSKF